MHEDEPFVDPLQPITDLLSSILDDNSLDQEYKLIKVNHLQKLIDAYRYADSSDKQKREEAERKFTEFQAESPDYFTQEEAELYEDIVNEVDLRLFSSKD